MYKNERLKKAYEYLRSKGFVHTQKELAEKMDASQSNVSSAFNGVESVLTDKFLLRFNNAFDNKFNTDWLLIGKGEMLTDRAKSVKERFIKFLDYIGDTKEQAEQYLKFPEGFIDNMTDNIHPYKINIILQYYNTLNRTWLLTGEGNMLNNNKQDFTMQNTTNEQQKNDLSDYETWLLPQTAHGGSLTDIPADGTFLQNCEKIVSPIKGVDFAISVYGESMSPEYPSGSRVLIKKINHNAYIDWGKAYVIDTCNGVIIKEILKCQREGFITCHSINPDPKFADFDLSLNDVYGIYRVLMCLSAK